MRAAGEEVVVMVETDEHAGGAHPSIWNSLSKQYTQRSFDGVCACGCTRMHLHMRKHACARVFVRQKQVHSTALT